MKNPEHRKIWFDDLKSHGYSAIIDNFDVSARLHSDHNQGYTSSTIVFDRSKSLKQIGSRKIDSKEMQFIKDLANRGGKSLIKSQAFVSKLYQSYKKTGDWASVREAAINEYKKEHPNTQMTDNQIALSLFG